MAFSVALPDHWDVSDDTVSFRQVVESAVCSYQALDRAVREGLVKVIDRVHAGRGSARRLTVEEALMVMVVAAIAANADASFLGTMRAMRLAGAKITPRGLVIPVRTAA
ncbi:hypothetical protein ABZ845_30860 [Streptomyces sp. NPDC047022]|uniref:hypothetical protein n=1 Tax=Streptomyces sp. NPDC047022 TaxID=3155737 RepID=UPI0033CDD7BD